jgi:hypothetical protein
VPAHRPGLLTLYDDQPTHPFNVLHRALFEHPHPVERAACLAGPPGRCDHLESRFAGVGTLVRGSAAYEEHAALLASRDLRFLGEAIRYDAAMLTLRAVRQHLTTAAPPATPGERIARLLLQHDLWERFDALDALLDPASRPRPGDHHRWAVQGDARARLTILRDRIGGLMRQLALPRAVIEQLPSNVPALVAAYPELLGGLRLTSDETWTEVFTRAQELPPPDSGPFLEGTRHARVAGYRAVFRRFVRPPGSAANSHDDTAWLRRQLASSPPGVALPMGSRMAILEVPLVVSAEGEVVPLPLAILVETRLVRPQPEQGLSLRDLGLEVLEGRRALLRRPGSPGGGLVRLAYDAPFPMGGSCGPDPTILLPMRSTCIACHGPSGEQLTGMMMHGEQRLRAARPGAEDTQLEARLAISAKLKEPDFAALMGLFRAPGLDQ